MEVSNIKQPGKTQNNFNKTWAVEEKIQKRGKMAKGMQKTKITIW